MREIDKSKKKNDINEMIISQLKKELEKYAFTILQMQDHYRNNKNGLD
jgi:hypothetical protein